MVRQRFGDRVSEVRTVERTLLFDYPFEPAAVVQFFRSYFGPTMMAFSRLDAAGQSAYRADLEQLWRQHNEGAEGHTRVRAEYLEVIATRA